jgi:hypothetical protein
MALLSSLTSRVTHWVRDNVTGGGPGDIDQDYGRIEEDLGRVKDELDKIDEETRLRPPSLSSFKDGDLILSGAAVGGALGATAGLANSLITAGASQPEVILHETTHPINKPVLVGFTEQRTEITKQIPVYDGTGRQVGTTQELQGWRVTHQASINQEKVGEYTTREAEVRRAGGGSPLSDGLVGLAVGAGLGAGVGAAVAVTRRLTGKGLYEEHPRRSTEGDLRIMARTGAVGAAAGAGIGFLSGWLESGTARTIEYKTEQPVYQRQQIGTIPGNYEISALSSSRPTPPQVPVEADVPKTHLTLTGRQPDVQTIEKRVEVEPRYGMVGAVVGGAIVGGIAGVATGVLINVLRKTI